MTACSLLNDYDIHFHWSLEFCPFKRRGFHISSVLFFLIVIYARRVWVGKSRFSELMYAYDK